MRRVVADVSFVKKKLQLVSEPANVSDRACQLIAPRSLFGNHPSPPSRLTIALQFLFIL